MQKKPPTPSLPRVLLKTERGEILLEIDSRRAPRSAANFLRYVDGGLYNGGVFHRTVKPDNQPGQSVKIEVIQGGIAPGKKTFPPIALERTKDTGLRHKDGTLSMARAEPDTASGDFFVCIGDQPELDYGGKRNPDGQGFAAFGKVLKGKEIVRKIQQSAAQGQSLVPPIKIFKAERIPPK